MFLVTDEITREYHIALPEGPFSYGYAVDASWWPPNNIPVTDPATDFPKFANSEDPWKIDFEQLLPICEDSIGKDIFKITVHHRGTDQEWYAWVYGWGMNYNDPDDPQFGYGVPLVVDDYTTDVTIDLKQIWWNSFGNWVVPGHHDGLVIVFTQPDHEGKPTTELWWVCGFKFVDLYVAE